MNTPSEVDPARSAWQSQLPPGGSVSPDFVRAMASRLDGEGRVYRNLVNGATLGAAALVLFAVAVFIWGPHKSPFNFRLTMLVAIGLAFGGAALIAWHVNRQTRWPKDGAAVDPRTSLEAYRQELIRQRDLNIHDNRPWSIWPMLPAVLALEIAELLYDPIRRRAIALALFAGVGVVVGTAVGVAIGRQRTRAFQLELEALASLERGT
jgi:hypothetical protein